MEDLDYKSLIGVLSVMIVCANHCYYLTLTYLHRIRPHAFALLVYLIVTCSVAAGMYLAYWVVLCSFLAALVAWRRDVMKRAVLP